MVVQRGLDSIGCDYSRTSIGDAVMAIYDLLPCPPADDPPPP